MERIARLWRKIPVVVRAVVVGMLVQILGIMPIIFLLQTNVQYLDQFPWAFVAGALYLWLFVNYIRGKGWPAATSKVRSKYFRMNPMSPSVRKWAMVSGFFLSLTIACMVIWGWLFTEWPTGQSEMLKALAAAPKMTIISLLVLATVATGIIEESAYRGYMQVPVETRHGPIIAILISSLVFALSHPLPYEILPFFVLGSLGWGALAFLSNSNLPGMIFHALVDLPFFIWGIYNVDVIESMLRYSVLESGSTQGFTVSVTMSMLFAAATIFSLWKLKQARAGSEDQLAAAG